MDPDDQGTRWLERHEAADGLVIVRASEADNLLDTGTDAKITVLEDALSQCVPHGRPLLVRDLQGDPPQALHGVLFRRISMEGKIPTINVIS